MKAVMPLAAAMLLWSHSAQGRLFQIVPPSELIAKSKLVFVGRVTAVLPSGISTTLSYVPWEGVTFHWLAAKVDVMEPFKGTRKGEAIRVAMLTSDQEVINHPFVLDAEKGDLFLFCLLPTPVTNLFAALTVPYNEALSVIALHRSRPYTQGVVSSVGERREFSDRLLRDDKRFSPIFDLADQEAHVVAANAERLRSAFAAELAAKGSREVMPLQWQIAVSIGGWRSDIPKGTSAWTGSNNVSGPTLSK
jgi:hypothetical protein